MENDLKEFDFTKDEIKLDNSIVEKAIGGLNQNAFSLFSFLCADFCRENLVETPDIFKLTIKNSDFLNSIGYTSNSGYVDIKKYFKALQQTIFEIPYWDKGKLAGEVITGLILKSVIHKKGTTTVWITKELAPYYYTMKVERDRTIARYNILKELNSEFSSKIYFMLVRWRAAKGKKLVLEVERLKEMLGVKGKYKDFYDFEKRTLTQAKKEINEKTDIIMDYKKLALGEASGKGRKPITHIEFSFKMKNEQEIEELLTDQQIEELLEIAEKRVIASDKTAKGLFDYAFAVTQENLINKKGFYKYMKKILLGDVEVYIGQLSMNANPEFRAMAKADKISSQLTNEKKARAKRLREKSDAELEAHIEAERQERVKVHKDDRPDEISFDFLKGIGDADEND